VEPNPDSQCARERLAAEIHQFRELAQEKARTLSCIDYFLWHKGVEDSLKLGRQALYARMDSHSGHAVTGAITNTSEKT
jgi:hypothetical protein